MSGDHYWSLKKRILGKVLNLKERSNFSESNKTIFHVTHPKAGSQWIKDVLSVETGSRCVRPQQSNRHFLDLELKQGYFYPTLYVSKEQFDRTLQLNPDISYRAFYVMRDLRDTLVSLYFSLKYSHKVMSDNIRKQRDELAEMSDKEGLIHLVNTSLGIQNRMQMSWLSTDVEVFKYEDLIADQYSEFARLFDFCGLEVSDKKLREIVSLNDFSSVTRGRERGAEDISKHQRKGISGDWQNHFDEEIKDTFKQRFGATLIATGYENDMDW